MRYKQYKLCWVKTSNREIFDLLKAWLGISLAFGLAFAGISKGLGYGFLISLAVTGTAFLIHELSHKVVAQKYNYPAEFRAFDNMIILAIIVGFFGFVIAAPGAVMIKMYKMDVRKYGKIALAGPLSNILLAVLFMIIFYTIPGSNVPVFSGWGIGSLLIGINGFIALFNMIPVWMFDGAKIWKWNKPVYIVTTLVAIAIVIFAI